jgi:hypothetical protein
LERTCTSTSIEDRLFDIIEVDTMQALAARGGKPIEKLPCHRAVDVVLVNRPALQVREQNSRGSGERPVITSDTKSRKKELAQHFAVTSANLERASVKVDALQEAVDVVGRC